MKKIGENKAQIVNTESTEAICQQILKNYLHFHKYFIFAYFTELLCCSNKEYKIIPLSLYYFIKVSLQINYLSEVACQVFSFEMRGYKNPGSAFSYCVQTFERIPQFDWVSSRRQPNLSCCAYHVLFQVEPLTSSACLVRIKANVQMQT